MGDLDISRKASDITDIGVSTETDASGAAKIKGTDTTAPAAAADKISSVHATETIGAASSPPKLPPPDPKYSSPTYYNDAAFQIDMANLNFLAKWGISPDTMEMQNPPSGGLTTEGLQPGNLSGSTGPSEALGEGEVPKMGANDPLASNPEVMKYANFMGITPEAAAKALYGSLKPLDLDMVLTLNKILSNPKNLDPNSSLYKERKGEMTKELLAATFTPPLSREEKRAFANFINKDLDAYIAFVGKPGSKAPPGYDLLPDAVKNTINEINTSVGIKTDVDIQKVRFNAMVKLLSEADFKPPLTKEQKDLIDDTNIIEEYVAAYLSNPNAPVPDFLKNLSPSVKLALDAINNAVISGIKSEVDTISSSPAYTERIQNDKLALEKANNAFDMIEDQTKQAKKLADSLPEFPGKDDMINFLKVISVAIAKLRDIISEMSNGQNEASRRATMMQIDETKKSIDLQQKERDKMEKSTKEMSKSEKSKNDLKKFSDKISKAVLVCVALAVCVAFPAVGVFMLAAAIIYITVPKEKYVKFLQENIFKPIANACGPVVGGALNVILSIIISGGHPVILTEQLGGRDGPLDTTLMASGAYGNPVDEKKRAIALMIITIITAIAATIVTLGCTGGFDVASLAEKILTIVVIVSTLVQTSMSIAQNVIQIQMAKIEKKIIRNKEKIEIMEEVITQLKKIIQKLVETLIEAVQANPDMVLKLTQMETKMYTDRSLATNMA